MPRRPDILVFGPAYLDRVIRVDAPLLDPKLGAPPVDRSVDGAWAESGGPGDPIRLVDALGSSLTIEPPGDYAGPTGTIRVARPLAPTLLMKRQVRGEAASDDLGGMGAGFAAALGGTLACALGPPDDPTSRAVLGLLAQYGIECEPTRIADRPADWTLLISSGEHGDKLAVGFRGCHAAWRDPDPENGPGLPGPRRRGAAEPRRRPAARAGRAGRGPRLLPQRPEHARPRRPAGRVRRPHRLPELQPRRVGRPRRPGRGPPTRSRSSP